MQTNLATFLWFDGNAGQAARHYCDVFPHATLTAETPMSASFEIDGQRYIAFNGGPHHKLTPAVSLMVSCDTQDEVDALWARFLGAGGTESRCGWLVDAFGLSWQIIPRALPRLMGDPDRAAAQRVVAAMMTMQKIDIAALERAHAGVA